MSLFRLAPARAIRAKHSGTKASTPACVAWFGIEDPGALCRDPRRLRRLTSPIIVSRVEIVAFQRLAESRHRDPDELVGWLEDALARSAPTTDDPGADWTQAEIDVLDAEGVDVRSRPDSPDVIGAGYRHYLGILASGLSVADVAARLNVTSSRVRQLLSQRRLYGIRPRGRAWVIPSWQLVGDQLLPGVEPVNQAIPEDCHPLAVDGFFHTEQPELEEGDTTFSPLAWLQRGGDPSVVEALAGDL